jgi:hypothetical protein
MHCGNQRYAIMHTFLLPECTAAFKLNVAQQHCIHDHLV